MPRHSKTFAFALLSLLIAGSAFAGPAPFTTTTLVAGNNAPVVNGANLIAAVAAATPPALVKLEPGTYDLSGQQILMRDLVDIEGSGRDVTFIVSDVTAAGTDAVVRAIAGVEAELRQLTVRNTSLTTGTGVSIATSEFLLTEVTTEVQAASISTGVLVFGASPRINEVFARVSGTSDATGYTLNGGGPVITQSLAFVLSPGSANVGLRINNGASALLDGVIVFTLSGATNVGVSVGSGANAEILNTRVTASGGSDARGAFFGDTNTTGDIKESTFIAEGDTNAAALQVRDAFVKSTESTFIARPIADDSVNVFAFRLSGSANTDTNQSNLDGSSFAVNNTGTGIARFGASQLIGTASPNAAASLKCIFAYSGLYNARNATCQ